MLVVCASFVGPGTTATTAQVVSVAPVITTTPTPNIDARFPGALPPSSVTRIDDLSTFYIEVWASNVGAPFGGLACVHVDLSYERTDLIDAIPPRQNGHLFTIEFTTPTFNDPVGTIDEIGGCQSVPPVNMLGVDEWVLIERIEMFANGLGGPMAVTLSDAGDIFAGTAIVGQMNNVDPADIVFQSRSFSIGECGGPADCDDGNDCTSDSCIGNVCSHSDVGGACEDGDLCTENTFCTTGVCGGGNLVDCSPLDTTCALGLCNPANGACEAQPDNEGGFCDDLVPCTQNDVCTAGVCTGAPVDCSGLDGPCALGECNVVTGLCESSFINEGLGCDDGNEGTFDDVCVSGTCLGDFRVVQIAPIVMATPSLNPRFPGPDPPASTDIIDPDTTFYIELWATNDAAPLTGLACAHADLHYDRTDLMDSVSPAVAAPLFPISIIPEVFDDAVGDVGDLGGCQTVPPVDFLGVGEWVMVRRVEMLGVGRGGPVTVSLSDTENLFVGTSIVGQLNNLPPTEVNYRSVQFNVGNCQEFTYGDVNRDGIIDLIDILCVLDGFGGVFPICSFEAVDLVPCDPEPVPVIGLTDILAVLDAFEAAPQPCPNPCIPNGP